MNYMRLSIAWVQFIGMVLMILCTVCSYRTLKVAATKKEVTWLIVGWVAALVVLPLLMSYGVIILNNSRGQMVVEQDLADALNSGKVAFAGLDVVSTEPIRADNPLLTAKNCFITPHIAWATKEARVRLMRIAVGNLKGFIKGEIVNNVAE